MNIPEGASEVGEETYVVKKVLAERYFEETDKNGVNKVKKKWLVWWEGYGLHESTWEPKEHLVTEETDVLESFNLTRREKTPAGFRELQRRNIKRYEEAVEANAAGEQLADEQPKEEPAQEPEEEPEEQPEKAGAKTTKQPTKQLTKQPAKRNRRVVVTDSDDEDDVPLRSLKQTSQQQPAAPDAALATRKTSGAKPSEVVAPAKPTGGSLFVEQPSAVRKPPLLQSESEASSPESDDEGADTDDSLMNQAARKRTIVNSPDKGRQTRRKSGQAPTKQAPTVTTSKPATKPSETVPLRNTVTSIPNQQCRELVTQTGTADPGKKPTPAKRTVSNVAGTSTVASTTPATAANTGPSPVSRSVELPSAAKTGPDTGTNAPIKIVNEPKAHRKEWQSTKHFTTLKYRSNAVKKSAREGTPDIRVLDFVNTPPLNVAKARPRDVVDDPYGRREHRKPRVQEDPTDDIDTSRRRSTGATIPLQAWEADKIPLVCFDWRLSNNCIHGAQKCRFMHRNQDEQGRDYDLSDSEGRVPYKYMKPPVTCAFWLRGEKGCFKTDKECPYAHWNTGWLPSPENRFESVSIDPKEVPRSEMIMHAPTQPSDKRTKKHPSELTCWYWAEGTCRNRPEECAFQHYDTGHLADPPRGALAWKAQAEGKGDGSAPVNHKRYSLMTKDAIHGPAVPGYQTQQPRRLSVSTSRIDDGGQPDQADEIPRPLSPTPIEEPLRQPLPPPPPFPPAPEMTCSELEKKIAGDCKIRFEDILGGAFYRKNAVRWRAFLMYHPVDHSEDLELLTRWLLMQHVEVGNAWIDGAWDGFRQHVAKGGSGVILAHPDFESFTACPGFGETLRQKQVQLCSLGIQEEEGIQYDSAASESLSVKRRDCIEIFPLGGFIYITDEVFKKSPQLALKIIKLFIAKIAKLKQLDGPLSPWQAVDDAPLLWRLCVRPELMEYLSEECETHAMELLANDSDAQSYAQLYAFLHETKYIELDYPITPMSLASDYFPILSERRILAEVEPVDYFNTLARSQEQANLHMIRYYAGMQVDMRRDYRHFFVVHTEPEAPCVQKWKDEIQTIGAVITPEQCVAEFEKSSEESMFDFYERYMEVANGGDVSRRTDDEA